MATPAAVLAVVRAARPRCRTPADALAFALHAACLAEGWNVLAVDSGAGVDADVVARAADADADADPTRGWNAREDGQYAFRYERANGDGQGATLIARVLEDALVATLRAPTADDDVDVGSATFALGEHVDAAKVSAGDVPGAFPKLDATLERFLEDVLKKDKDDDGGGEGGGGGGGGGGG